MNRSTHTWDFDNRITKTVTPSFTSTMAYDPFGRRIYKSSTLVGNVYYTYDGANLVAEINTSGATVADYAQGQGIDQPLAMVRSGTKYYYQADGLGTITSLSNPAGAITNTYVYGAFGTIASYTGNAFINFDRYTGRELEGEIIWYYYRARYYDPHVGRFLSEDPIRFSGGSNFYDYVSNSPVNYADPSGLIKLPKGPWRDCKANEVAFCKADCASRGKIYISCMVGRRFGVKRLNEGQRWLDNPSPSCNCEEPPKCPVVDWTKLPADDDPCLAPRPVRVDRRGMLVPPCIEEY